MLIVLLGDVVNHGQQALHLVARSLVGLAVSCALVLQLLLIGLAYGNVAAAASSPDAPFVICYGNGGGDAADHGSDRQPVSPLHCLIICAQAQAGAAAALPAVAIILAPPRAYDTLSLSEARSFSLPNLALHIPREDLPCARDRLARSLITHPEESPMKRHLCALCAVSAAAVVGPMTVRAEPTALPPVRVDAPRPRSPRQRHARRRRLPKRRPRLRPPRRRQPPRPTSGTSLTVPNTAQATREIQRTPGARRGRSGHRFQQHPGDHHQGHPRFRTGRLGAAEMGRGQPPLDSRLRSVAQFPSARHPTLHGRHSDQHLRRLWRLPGNRSDRLPLCRGLQGRQCATLRRQFARRRHQFRDAKRTRRQPVRRPP